MKTIKNIVLASTCAMASAGALADKTLNVYNWSDYIAEDTLANFEAETGIKTNVLFARNGLVDRLSSEGQNSPADVLLTVDVGRLDAMKKADIWQAIPADGPILPGSWAYYTGVEHIDYDTDTALSILKREGYVIPAEGGEVRAKDGQFLAFSLLHG